METEITGSHEEQGIGVDVYDENEKYHWVVVMWDGEIDVHETDDYPHNREERSHEEQVLMSQVEERAKYAAQMEFPDANILDPMWDPRHLERGLEALSNYPLDQFHRDFRDFYDRLAQPEGAIPDSHLPIQAINIHKPFQIDADNRIVEVADVFFYYETGESESHVVGSPPDHWPDEETMDCMLPGLDFEDHVTFEEDFHEVLVVHLMAQIRDIYLNMGEEPPAEYRVEGIGKQDIYGYGALE
jgi:hypothetical protein